ncbi:MAG: DUF4097 family beta strand repeat-containing protein [Pyrinomonadaceae bacterium]
MAVEMFKIGVLLVSLCTGVTLAIAQQPPATPKPKAKPGVYKPGTPMPEPPSYPREEIKQTTEKSITVDPNVNLKMCVAEGNLKITGWERNEVRVFVRSGRLPGFKVLEKDPGSGKANWLMVTNIRAEGSPKGPMSECLSGADIELDVPLKSKMDLSGRSTETVIDSIKKVNVKTAEGDISIRNIAGGINAITYQGNLIVESSEGSIMLETTSGNILAFGVNPGQIGDLFKARTGSGNVTLQQVEHRQIEASSISGNVVFKGKLLAGGLYGFKTSSGSIRLQIPFKSSFTVKASYGFGAFASEIPLNYTYKNEGEGGQNLQASVGAGDSNINLTTSNGAISIRKL